MSGIWVPLAGGQWSSVNEIDFQTLPDAFVFKATHGCKMNYLVPDKTKLDKKKCMAEMSRWLQTTYGTYSMEPHYLKIPHRIYAENYLADADKLIVYKFHCMNGLPQLVLVCGARVFTEMGNDVIRHFFVFIWTPLVVLTVELSY